MVSSKITKVYLMVMMVGLVLTIGYKNAFASPQGNLTTSTPSNESSHVITQPSLVVSSVLNSADKDVNELNALKRKTEIQKATMELRKASNPTGIVTDSQTTAIGIIITQNSDKLATLQFIDGSTLDVEIGSKVGNYKVSDIDMSGVKLVNCNGRKCESKFIKRAYPQTAITTVNTKPKVYTSTPILGSANTEVPPIVVTN